MNTDILTDSQNLEAKYAFDLLDTSNTGTISLGDVKKILSQIGHEEKNDENLIRIFNDEFDDKKFSHLNKDDIQITFHDFQLIMKNRLQDIDIITELFEAFKILGGRDNLISINHLVKEMTKNGETLDEKALQEMIECIYQSEDEYINYAEMIDNCFAIKK